MKGRPPKDHVVRDSTTNRSRGDDEKHYRQLRLVYRARDMALDGLQLANGGVKGADPGDPLAGFTLGRLRLRQRLCDSDPAGISETQFRAGEAWARLCHRHAAIMGYELKPPKSPAAFAIVGRSVAPEPDEDVVFEIRRLFADCYNALMDACKDHGLNVRNVCYDVCIAGLPVHNFGEKDYGDLRIGLNALANVLDIGGEHGHGINANRGIRAWTG